MDRSNDDRLRSSSPHSKAVIHHYRLAGTGTAIAAWEIISGNEYERSRLYRLHKEKAGSLCAVVEFFTTSGPLFQCFKRAASSEGNQDREQRGKREIIT